MASTTPTSLGSLPAELVVMITQQLEHPGDRIRFATVSSRLHAIVNAEIYLNNILREDGTLLLWAAQHGRIDTLEQLLAMGANLDDGRASQLPAVYERLNPYDTRRVYASYPKVFYPLHVAAKFGQYETVKWLLDHGAKVDLHAYNLCCCMTEIPRFNNWSEFPFDYPRRAPACTALHIAVCNGHESTARLLLAHGAHPHAAQVRSTDRLCTTVLHTAARSGLVALIRYLVVETGILVDQGDPEGHTALYFACMRFDDLGALKELISLGANTMVCSHMGYTPAQFACYFGYFKAAMHLWYTVTPWEAQQVPMQRPNLPEQHNLALVQVPTLGIWKFFIGTPPPTDKLTWHKDRKAFLKHILSQAQLSEA